HQYLLSMGSDNRRDSSEITDLRQFVRLQEVVGAGQQQVRFVWANVGASHVCLWTFTMTEALAWSRPGEEWVDREAWPWDDPNRRRSHADKRRAWRRELLAEEIRAALRAGVTGAGIQAATERLPTADTPGLTRRGIEASIPSGPGRDESKVLDDSSVRRR